MPSERSHKHLLVTSRGSNGMQPRIKLNCYVTNQISPSCKHTLHTTNIQKQNYDTSAWPNIKYSKALGNHGYGKFSNYMQSNSFGESTMSKQVKLTSLLSIGTNSQVLPEQFKIQHPHQASRDWYCSSCITTSKLSMM